MVTGVEYHSITNQGIDVVVNGEVKTYKVDNIVICTGQNSLRALQQPLQQNGIKVHLIGGANFAAELDAKRAIREGTELGFTI
jgi:2,4-dienoyl-CoA reductase (NADPH2)